MTSPEDSKNTIKDSVECYPCGTPKNRDESKETCGGEQPLRSGLDRRTLLVGGLLTAGAVGYPLVKTLMNMAPTFIARNQSYEPGRLARTISDGLKATDIRPASLKRKRVLLKPNLIEPTRQMPHITTHPNMVGAVTEVLRSWGADVVIGEGPGHVRDTELAVHDSGLEDVLDALKVPFVDLNRDAVEWVPNRGNASTLEGFYLPRTVTTAELVISMPKMKTHHWVGVTASMKNMYGVIPGIIYGWPKNVLHHNGIPETVFDINASLPKTIGIVDGIVCMEGDGPIMGRSKKMGLVVIGPNLPALDATICRLMKLNPHQVPYLRLAANRLGPIVDSAIRQRGEPWQPSAKSFQILDRPHLAQLRNAELMT